MVDLAYTLMVFLFLIFNIVALVLKYPILSLLVGLVSLAVAGLAVTSTYSAEIVFSPYPQLLLLLTTVACWIKIAVGRR